METVFQPVIRYLKLVFCFCYGQQMVIITPIPKRKLLISRYYKQGIVHTEKLNVLYNPNSLVTHIHILVYYP